MDDIIYKISLMEASSDDDGNLKIVVTLNYSPKAKFTNVKAHLKDFVGKQKVKAEVMPVYLEKNRIDLHVISPKMYILPGQCDLKLKIEGSNQSSNTLRILQLSRTGGAK